MSLPLLNMSLAFVEGFALIASPCILPILPIVLAGSLSGSRKHPIGIIIGFVATFAVFTLFAHKLVSLLNVDLNILRDVSLFLLLVLGFVMLSGFLTELFARMTGGLATIGANISVANKSDGFLSGLVLGSLIGLIWTPCAGPILAAVIVQTVMQTTTWDSFFTVFAFGLGAALPMLIIAFAGRNILKRLNLFKTHAVLIRKILGIIVILTVCVMIYNNSMATPFGSKNVAATSSSSFSSGKTYTPAAPLLNPILKPYPAPEIAGITHWINSSPLTVASLKGKVVLIDFWAYSCINCIRTLPYLNSWHEKYHDKGLVIIGVHSPEFDFERDLQNVENAVAKDHIKYPVALDNLFSTWNNYHNSYWPAHYLIDKNGNVVYEKFGEGDYDVTENNIRFLLGMNEQVPMNVAPAAASILQTPETYLGYRRADSFVHFTQLQHDVAAQYTYPNTLPTNTWALQGNWIILPEKISAMSANAKIKIHFHAGKVFAVMGQHAGKTINVEVRLDGVLQKTVAVNEDTLYTLLELPTAQSGVLELTVSEPGLELYTFTFGN